ncbi:haloacid dehalogenase type II [Pikeienuella piscinae]|uniref:(S)-2-haloacid dehalogenase n=1 Tax=Pikeienuella piscinae TaxID=2748098 RepID=A0A7M3T5M4_9RHOB|nr:haloacid dehalogenase type II [Pikeienuella piscinae]QIE57305.1 haloacid dehalogenase type II [Pikeienuella piscinae]
MAIRAAVFDVFGTVVDWRGGVAAEMAAAFRAKDVDHDAAAFADAWRGEYQPAMERIRTGARGYARLDDLHRENLDIVLKARGLDGLFDAAERDALNHAWEHLPPWPDSVAGLAAIRERMPVATCSNGSISLMVALARFGGLVWDAVLGAEIAQGFKPDPKVYRASAAALGLAPDEVVMVASHNRDLAAARAAGLATAFVARPDEKGPGLGESRPESDWEFAADDLIDLSRRLG